MSRARVQWPKTVAALSPEQESVREDFMRYWHEVLPGRYSAIERFNQSFPLENLSQALRSRIRTLELGAGIGGHIAFEDLTAQDYTALELRDALAGRIKDRFPQVEVLVGDVQEGIPASDASFDRVIAIHVLEHLPNLPRALAEVRRVLKPDGRFSVVIPCEGGLLYGLGRDLTSRRLFERRYKCSYDWFIRAEHVNQCHEIVSELRKTFAVTRVKCWPLGIPLIHANVCLGIACAQTPLPGAGSYSVS